jgi:hypothetical protein
LDNNFYDDAKAGKLARFTWLQPRMTTSSTGLIPNWQHPDSSVAEGERLLQSVYEAIRTSPQWNETVLIITYDEHGGFYDHVAPPQEGIPAPDAVHAPNGFRFDRLGIRIPAIAISPWIPKGTVVHRAPLSQRPEPTSQYDATSMMATANKLFGITEHLGARSAWSSTFEHIFSGVVDTATGAEPAPRTDCPLTVDGWPELSASERLAEAAIQRAKPLNDHLAIQVDYYCEHTAPRLQQMAASELEIAEREHAAACETARLNQGTASDFIEERVEVFWSLLRGQTKSLHPVAASVV